MMNSGNRPADIFWGEMAPPDHSVQIYDEEPRLLDALEGFVFQGIEQDEGVILITAADHLELLEERLRQRGVSITLLKSRDQYIPLDASVCLSKFMVNDWPDEELFDQFISETLNRARGNGRVVRAFGEMVAVLWEQGHTGATVRLEHLWHSFCNREEFCLFCAYPRAGFTDNAEDSIRKICETHSRVIGKNKAH
jgi:MEDS: MEthanogen/methylotroph, DcmR Sensory domain